MSHITNVKLTVNDLDAIEVALEALGGTLELRRDQAQYETYYGGKPCAHAIGFKDGTRGFEIGLVADGDGFQTIVDTWGPSGQRLTSICGGPSLNRLRQEYAVAVTERRAAKALARKGFHATRENLSNGTVRLVLRKR